MRYIAEYLVPPSLTPKLGSYTRCVRRYESPYNALRYLPRHLRGGRYPAGQYRVSTWPELGSGRQPEIVGYIYKTV